VQWARGGLVLKAHRIFVSLNSRLESDKEEEEGGVREGQTDALLDVGDLVCVEGLGFRIQGLGFRVSGFGFGA